MDIYGLLGKKLGHSFSADFFNKKFHDEQIDASYKNFELSDISQLPELIRTNSELKGFNVTIPYKEDILSYLDEISNEAKAIGAVNVVKIVDVAGKKILKGFNTDASGFSQALNDKFHNLPNHALILGSGGASKAVKYALCEHGIETLIVSRQPGQDKIRYTDLTETVIQQNRLIVNATPLGMWPNVNEAPPIPYRLLSNRHICFDLIYNPHTTRFMQLAKENGAAISNGLDMLHNQAILSWEIWQRNE
jgi:shikimate dehydrogenase